MIVADSSLARFITPEIFSFLTDLETALLENDDYDTADPLQLVAEHLTGESLGHVDEREIIAALDVSYEASLVLKASVDGDKSDPNYSPEVSLRIQNIMDER